MKYTSSKSAQTNPKKFKKMKKQREIFKHNNKNNPFNNKLVVIKVGTYLAINNNQYKNKNQSLNPSKINYNRTLQMEQ